MKRLLIFHATIPSYRIDLFNKLTEYFSVKLIVYGKKENIEKLGFDYKAVANDAKFEYTVYDSGFYFGNNHLISTMYYHEIKKFKPDIVFCQELGINTLAAIAHKKVFGYKIYINCDDSPDMLLHYTTLRKWLRQYVYNKIDGVIVVHNEVEKKLRNLFPNCRLLYFPIIQDENRFLNKLEACKEISYHYIDKFKLENKSVYLFVGRLTEEKQPIMLIKAFQKAKITDSKLIIVGNGVLYDSIKKYIDNNNLSNEIILTGKLHGNQLYAWYRVADYFVLPSKFEPFGAVVNEALISGCKIITSDRVGANTLINEHNGKVFTFGDIDALSNALCEFSKEKKKKAIINRTPVNFDFVVNKLYNFISL